MSNSKLEALIEVIGCNLIGIDNTGLVTITESNGNTREPTKKELSAALLLEFKYEIKEKIRNITMAVQLHLDNEARSKGYDSIFKAVTYADEPAVASFQAEGLAFRSWRSLVWESCNSLLNEWEAGNIEEPTELEVIASLPTI